MKGQSIAMDTKIDYLAFTVGTHPLPKELTDDVQDYVMSAFANCGVAGAWADLSKLEWEVTPARGFYRWCAREKSMSMSISWGDTNNHIYVQFPGLACEFLRDREILDAIIAANSERMSRIDFATDIECSTGVDEFARARGNNRIKTEGGFRSEQGDTYYLGSRTSDRFARVYRYHPPHPRARWLRIEIELKHDAARKAAALYLHSGLLPTAQAAHLVFSWQHPTWQPLAEQASVLRTQRYDREGSTEVRWLLTAVLPALKKYQSTGLFDVRSWLLSEVLPELEKIGQRAGEYGGEPS
jgi:DNA relaxase NicK